MRALFYNVVEMFTEKITGIENGAIKIWEFERYMRVSDNIAVLLNVSIATIIAVLAMCIIRYAKKTWVNHGNV